VEIDSTPSGNSLDTQWQLSHHLQLSQHTLLQLSQHSVAFVPTFSCNCPNTHGQLSQHPVSIFPTPSGNCLNTQRNGPNTQWQLSRGVAKIFCQGGATNSYVGPTYFYKINFLRRRGKILPGGPGTRPGYACAIVSIPSCNFSNTQWQLSQHPVAIVSTPSGNCPNTHRTTNRHSLLGRGTSGGGAGGWVS
jgi:hypothetical protein